MKRNRWNVPFYINLQKKPAEPAFGKWVFIEKMSKYQPGIENLWYHKNRNLSVEDMQRHSEHKGFSGFSMGNIEVNFKRYDYQLTEEHLKPNEAIDGIWIWQRPEAKDIAVTDSPDWLKIPLYDIFGEDAAEKVAITDLAA